MENDLPKSHVLSSEWKQQKMVKRMELSCTCVIGESEGDCVWRGSWRSVRSLFQSAAYWKERLVIFRGPGRWTSKSDHRQRSCVVTRLNRNQVVKMLRLVCRENLTCQRKRFIFNTFAYFEPVKRFNNMSDVRIFWRSGDSTSKRVVDVLLQWVAAVKFRMNNRSGDGTISFFVIYKSRRRLNLCLLLKRLARKLFRIITM